MKAAIVTTIASFLACTVFAAPVPQGWVPPPRPGGVSLSSPIGGVTIGPDGFYANGLLGGVSFGGQPHPPPQPQYQPQYQQQGGWGRGWNTAVEGETAQLDDEDSETAQPEEAVATSAPAAAAPTATSAPAEEVEGTD